MYSLEGLLLALLLVAHGTPVLLDFCLGARLAFPVDGYRLWRDNRPLFGLSKTWRGILGALFACSLLAAFLDISLWFAAGFALMALAGDLFSSFCKRRMGFSSSSQVVGLDQLPESLLPLTYAWCLMGFPAYVILQVTVLFFLIELFFSPLLFRIGLRKRPH